MSVHIPLYVVEIRHEVKDRVRQLCQSGEHRDRLINVLVEHEIIRRADLLSRGFNKREEMARDLEEMRNSPDIVHVPSDDLTDKNARQSFFTPEKAKKITETQSKLDKIDKAIEAALSEEPDFSQLEKVV